MYNHLEVEKKWQKYWEDHETFKTDIWDFSKPKYYFNGKNHGNSQQKQSPPAISQRKYRNPIGRQMYIS